MGIALLSYARCPDSYFPQPWVAVIVVSNPASDLSPACLRRFQQQVAQPFRLGTGQLDRLGGVGQRRLGKRRVRKGVNPLRANN